MKFLKSLGAAVCALSVPAVIFSSTAAGHGAILLEKRNYNEVVSFGSAEQPTLRDFYVVVAHSPKWNYSGTGFIVRPFETPKLDQVAYRSFVLDAATPDKSGFASQPIAFDEQFGEKELRLYVGFSTDDGDAVDSRLSSSPGSLVVVDSYLAGSELAFVRFDIKQWEVSGSVVSYDIDISFWGEPAATVKKVAALDS